MLPLYQQIITSPYFAENRFKGAVTINNLEALVRKANLVKVPQFRELKNGLLDLTELDFPLKRVLLLLQKVYNKSDFEGEPELNRFAVVATLCTLTVISICLHAALPAVDEVDELGDDAMFDLTAANVKMSSRDILFSIGSYDEDYTKLSPELIADIKKAVAFCQRKLGVMVTFKRVSGFYVFMLKFSSFDEYKEIAENVLRYRGEDLML